MYASPRVGENFLCEATIAHRHADAIAFIHAGRAFAYGLDDARDFAAGRKGQCRPELIFVLNHQHIRKVHCAGLYGNEYLVLPRSRRGQVLQFHFFRWPIVRAEERLHVSFSVRLTVSDDELPATIGKGYASAKGPVASVLAPPALCIMVHGGTCFAQGDINEKSSPGVCLSDLGNRCHARDGGSCLSEIWLHLELER